MATLESMVEHCESCGVELELGQIGLCDDCQRATSAERAEEGDDVPDGSSPPGAGRT